MCCCYYYCHYCYCVCIAAAAATTTTTTTVTVCVLCQVVKLPQMRLLSQQLLLDVLDALANEMIVARCNSDMASLHTS